jgi:hypothetical protein
MGWPHVLALHLGNSEQSPARGAMISGRSELSITNEADETAAAQLLSVN